MSIDEPGNRTGVWSVVKQIRSTQRRRHIFTLVVSVVLAVAATPALSLERIGWFEILTAGLLGGYIAGLHIARVVIQQKSNTLMSWVLPILVSALLWLALSFWPETCAGGCSIVDRGKWAMIGALYAATLYVLRLTLWPLWVARKLIQKRKAGSEAKAKSKQQKSTGRIQKNGEPSSKSRAPRKPKKH